MSASHTVPDELLYIRNSSALLRSNNFAGESMTYSDYFSMSIDRLSLLRILALALVSIAVSTAGFMQALRIELC